MGTSSQLLEQFNVLKKAQLEQGIPTAAERKARLQKCIDLLVDNQHELAAALDKDYNGRSPYLTLMSEVMTPINHLKFAIKNVEKWMKPERRSAPPSFDHWNVISRPSVKFDPWPTPSRNHAWKFQVSPAAIPTVPPPCGTAFTSIIIENVPVEPELWIWLGCV